MAELYTLWETHWKPTGEIQDMATEFAYYYMNIDEIRGCWKSECEGVGEIFVGLDTDCSGNLSMDEAGVLDVLLPLANELPRGGAAQVWHEADLDKDGKVSIEELAKWLQLKGIRETTAAQAIEQALIAHRLTKDILKGGIAYQTTLPPDAPTA
eukprot:TRINITY_DN52984_c0_g1_i1.p1 TRINITY_DN52984_c0_g1~~TRINITY_DN52984_c0_g1_i1.p1  ORF type:complete len:154 (-),score=41.34 TRINITY_DN52984_c0_g1_i1:69-530(-)